MSDPIATKILYHNAPAELGCAAEVLATGEDERGAFVVLDQTVFYPQGGGQPADLGVFITPAGDLSLQPGRR
jgi:alanyl-tRNA synthetase